VIFKVNQNTFCFNIGYFLSCAEYFFKGAEIRNKTYSGVFIPALSSFLMHWSAPVCFFDGNKTSPPAQLAIYPIFACFFHLSSPNDNILQTNSIYTVKFV